MRFSLTTLIAFISFYSNTFGQDRLILRDTALYKNIFLENTSSGTGFHINKIYVNGKLESDFIYNSLFVVSLEKHGIDVGDYFEITAEYKIGNPPKFHTHGGIYSSSNITYEEDTTYIQRVNIAMDDNFKMDINKIKNKINVNKVDDNKKMNGYWVITNKNYNQFLYYFNQNELLKQNLKIEEALKNGYVDTRKPNETYDLNPEVDTITSYLLSNTKKIYSRKGNKDYLLKWVIPWHGIYERTKYLKDTVIYASGYFLHGNKSGLWKNYAIEGYVEVFNNYLNDSPKGIYEKYNRKGHLLNIGTYDLGGFIGENLHFYENGNIKKKMTFGDKHNPVGLIKEYYENEKVKSIQSLSTNFQLHLNENGEIIKVDYLKDGIIIDTTFEDSTQILALKAYADIENQKAETREKLVLSEKENAVSSAKNKTQQIIIYIILGAIVVICFFIYMLIKSLKLIRVEKKHVMEQKEEIEEAHKEIKDSISYAKRIQNAILPSTPLINEYLPNNFVYYQPKDIVAGDFYWLEPKNGNVLFAAADCTGHGVPGAMVSVVCNNSLNRAVREFNLSDPAQILDKTREIVIDEFQKSVEDVKDGMDISLCNLDTANLKLSWAGANNPLWVIRNKECIEFKPDKQPIGKFDQPKPYTSHHFDLIKGDCIYIFSDGYIDQFGGEKGKKFKASQLKSLFLSIQNLSMEKQKAKINLEFQAWKGQLEQVDDICVIGVKV